MPSTYTVVTKGGDPKPDEIEADGYQVEGDGALIFFERPTKFRTKEVARYAHGEWRAVQRKKIMVLVKQSKTPDQGPARSKIHED